MNYKYRFFDDYSEGAHPNILDALIKTNLDQETGYGDDSFCVKAVEALKDKVKNSKAAIHFVSGGTQANLIILASMLKPYESVIAPTTAHIAVHEAGAIEATGHKINTILTDDGKLTIEKIKEVVEFHTDEHMVKPKVVFISNSTEVGTIYTKDDLSKLSAFCRENNLYLYLDGARLGSALMVDGSDLILPDVAKLVDIFYIGGTKNGALLGEAIVIVNEKLQENFRYHMKQRGALLAKGRVLGIQFLELFKDDLFFQLAKHANKMAAKLTQEIKGMGFKFLTDSPTNQIFPILPNSIISKLQEDYGFYVWKKIDEENLAIRLVTSWATKEEAIDNFLSDLKALWHFGD